MISIRDHLHQHHTLSLPDPKINEDSSASLLRRECQVGYVNTTDTFTLKRKHGHRHHQAGGFWFPIKHEKKRRRRLLIQRSKKFNKRWEGVENGGQSCVWKGSKDTHKNPLVVSWFEIWISFFSLFPSLLSLPSLLFSSLSWLWLAV